MTEQLHTSILNLRAAVLTRRIKLQGHDLPSNDAQRLVRAHNDTQAYEGALQQVQRQSFWNRFWWNR